MPKWIEVEAKHYVLRKRFDGLPRTRDFKVITEKYERLNRGEILVEAELFSIDPWIRELVIPSLKIGDEIPGIQVARVCYSKCPTFAHGQLVVGYFGWRDWTVLKPSKYKDSVLGITKRDDPGPKEPPPSCFLGMLGLPGITAYYGILELKLQGGETCVITNAGGAVGSIAVQIAKMRGARIIAIAGNEKKKKWLADELNVQKFINYKDRDFKDALRRAAPAGVDCFFDCYAGPISNMVLKQVNEFGRVVYIGTLSTLTSVTEKIKYPAEPLNYAKLRKKNIRISSITPRMWAGKPEEEKALAKLTKWAHDKKIIPLETVSKGFKTIPKSLKKLMSGENLGKTIVKADQTNKWAHVWTHL